MEGMERKLPASIDYSAVLPMSVPAESRRRKFYPTNGGTFTSSGNSEIRIPISSTNALLDAAHSYLTFTLTNDNAALTFSPDIGGAAMMFSRVRVEQQGKVLSDTNEYNRLVASVINPVSETRDGRLAGTIRDLTRAGNFPGVPNLTPSLAGTYRGDKAAFSCHNNPLMLDTAAAAANGSGSFTFTMPLITGLFTQDKLIPLPLVDKNNPLTIVLTMDDVVNMGVFAGVGVPAAGSLSITGISYNAQLVEVGPDVISQFSMMRDMLGGQLALSGHDWEHNSAFLEGGAGGGGGERIVPIPMRKRSIKSLFWVANSSDLANTAGPLVGLHLVYNKSFSGSCNISSYQLKVGSVVYPPTAIAGPGQALLAVSQTRRGECLMELCKAMGTLSFSAPSGALLNTLTYMADQGSAVAATTADGDNGAGGATLVPDGADAVGVCPFGLDLEAFQHTALESGVDTETLALQTNLILNIDPLAGDIGAESKTIHSWICYDKHYYFNDDGSVSFSD